MNSKIHIPLFALLFSVIISLLAVPNAAYAQPFCVINRYNYCVMGVDLSPGSSCYCPTPGGPLWGYVVIVQQNYNPPAPRYNPPAPRYNPPAPRYNPPAPRRDPPMAALPDCPGYFKPGMQAPKNPRDGSPQCKIR